jgi:hypothetical protein
MLGLLLNALPVNIIDDLGRKRIAGPPSRCASSLSTTPRIESPLACQEFFIKKEKSVNFSLRTRLSGSIETIRDREYVSRFLIADRRG